MNQNWCPCCGLALPPFEHDSVELQELRKFAKKYLEEWEGFKKEEAK